MADIFHIGRITKHLKKTTSTVYRERALLIGIVNHTNNPAKYTRRNSPHRTSDTEHNSLDELAKLSETAGAIVVDKIYQRLDTPTPKFYIGSGKVQEIAATVAGNEIDVIIFDNNLSPAQTKNLEMAFNTKVIDRTELILDIFAPHA